MTKNQGEFNFYYKLQAMCHFESATLHLSGRLSPNNRKIINARTSKLAGRYFHHFESYAEPFIALRAISCWAVAGEYVTPSQLESATLLLAVGCRFVALQAMRHFDFAALHLSGRLSPYKMAKINALTSKLVGRYFCHFTWLVA